MAFFRPRLTLVILVTSFASIIPALSQERKIVTSRSGKVSVSVPGAAEKSIVTRKTLSGGTDGIEKFGDPIKIKH